MRGSRAARRARSMHLAQVAQQRGCNQVVSLMGAVMLCVSQHCYRGQRHRSLTAGGASRCRSNSSTMVGSAGFVCGSTRVARYRDGSLRGGKRGRRCCVVGEAASRSRVTGLRPGLAEATSNVECLPFTHDVANRRPDGAAAQRSTLGVEHVQAGKPRGSSRDLPRHIFKHAAFDGLKNTTPW